jgi:hypothetical protein
MSSLVRLILRKKTDPLVRISLLSQDKPHERTHRRERLILNVTENDVCLNNGTPVVAEERRETSIGVWTMLCSGPFFHRVLHIQTLVEERPRAEHRPHTYRGLSSFFSNHGRNQRISLLSPRTSYSNTDAGKTAWCHASFQRARVLEVRRQWLWPLSSFFSNHGRNQRISLLSQDKPHERTHRRERLILNVIRWLRPWLLKNEERPR